MHPYLLPHLMGGCTKTRVKRGLLLNAAATAFAARTPAVASNQKVWTWDGFVKRSKIGAVADQTLFAARLGSDFETCIFRFTPADTLQLFARNSANVVIGSYATSAVFRDPTAWLHAHVAVDTTHATASERVKIWISGIQATLSVATSIAQNLDLAVNGARPHAIGAQNVAGADYFDGYMAEVHFIDGLALGPEHFGRFDPKSGAWMPIIPDIADYGANGFYLPFIGDAGDAPATAAEGFKDRAPIAAGHAATNNFTPANIATTDFVKDTPTNYRSGEDYRGNFCTLNPVDAGPLITVGGGGLETSRSAGTAGYSTITGTQTFRSGEFYFELIADFFGVPGRYQTVGITADETQRAASQTGLINSYGLMVTGDATASNQGLYNNGGEVPGYRTQFATGDCCGIHVNLNTLKMKFFKNGVQIGADINIPNGKVWRPFVSLSSNGSTSSALCKLNFGQRAFNYPGVFPDTARPICVAAMRSNAVRPTTGFGQVNESAATVQAALAAKRSGWPAWVEWYKRTDAAEHWRMRFSDDPGNVLEFSSTAVKAAFPALAGTYFGAAMRVGLEYGILTGTVVHATGAPTPVIDNAGSVRKAIMLRSEAAGVAGRFYHPDLTPGSLLMLNSTAAETADTHITNVTANSFDIGAAAPSGTYRWFMMINTPGRVSIDSYQGNGSLDGPNPNWGFTAAMFFGKTRSSAVSSINLWSTLLDPVNPVSNRLQLNNDIGINAFAVGDVTANGVKLRTTDTQNLNGAIVVTVAFAGFSFAPGECPAQATAR